MIQLHLGLISRNDFRCAGAVFVGADSFDLFLVVRRDLQQLSSHLVFLMYMWLHVLICVLIEFYLFFWISVARG